MRPQMAGRLDSAARRMLFAGVLSATCIVPLAVDPSGFNPFGPTKTLVLCLSCLLILTGFAVNPASFFGGWPVVRDALSARILGAFIGITLLSTVLSIDPLQSLVGSYPEYQGVLSFTAYLLVGFGAVVLMHEDVERFRSWFGRGLIVTVLAICTIALLQRVGLDPVEYRWSPNIGRARSTLGNSSNLGLYLVIALPMLVERVRCDRTGAWRLCAGLACLFGLVVLVWTSSRGAWVGLVAAVIVWLAFEAVRWSKATRIRVSVAVLAASTVAAILVGALAPGVASRIASSLDLASGTERWRLSVWNSSFLAAADSPALGWGPNSMRFVYPLYRGDDLAAGASDAQIVGDAHNLFVNTALERGMPAALILAAWFGALLVAAWRQRDEGDGNLTLVAASASLVAGLVALQFHFLTLDTGPLFLAVTGVITFAASTTAGATESRRSRASSNHAREAFQMQPAAVLGLWLAIALALGASLLVIGLVNADRAISRGMSAAESGAGWAEVSAHFEVASRWAPWEPAIPWAQGRAAIGALRNEYDERTLTEALVALERASERLRHDMRLEADMADLVLASALSSMDERLFFEALERYDVLIAKDPRNGVLWIGRGSALAGLGRWEDAVEVYESGTRLAQRSIPGWLNLAVAYEQIGAIADAERARARAAEIAAEDQALGAPTRY